MPGRSTRTCTSSRPWRPWPPIAIIGRSSPEQSRSRCIIWRSISSCRRQFIPAGVLIWLARKLSHLFETTTQKTAEAEAANAAEARANANRAEADLKAKQERDAAMRGLAAEFERKVGHIVEAVAVAAREMQGMSSSMSNRSGEAARQTAAAASASTQASLNVGTVASAAEELTASISEIAHQATRSASVTGK